MKRHIRIVAVVSVLGAAAALAGNLPSIQVRTQTSRSVTAAASTNQPTVCTTNIVGQERALLAVINTNAADALVLYAGSSNDRPVAVIAPATTWEQKFPIMDSGTYSLGTTGAPRTGLVRELWGN